MSAGHCASRSNNKNTYDRQKERGISHDYHILLLAFQHKPFILSGFFKPDKNIFPGKFPAMQHDFNPVVLPHQGIVYPGIGYPHFSGAIFPFRDTTGKIDILQGMIVHRDCQPPLSRFI